MRIGAAVIAALAGVLLATPLVAQDVRPADAPARTVPADVPPPGGIVPRTRNFALGVGVGALRWDEVAPYDDLLLTSVGIERTLWRWLRGRAGMGYGTTTLEAELRIDTRVYAFDLQIVLIPDFGPLAAIGIAPYGVAGVGSLVTDPTDEPEGLVLTTRSQSQVTYGGGVRARFRERWELRGEAVASSLRLADPLDPEENDTRTIHNLRWEGRLSWIF